MKRIIKIAIFFIYIIIICDTIVLATVEYNENSNCDLNIVENEESQVHKVNNSIDIILTLIQIGLVCVVISINFIYISNFLIIQKNINNETDCTKEKLDKLIDNKKKIKVKIIQTIIISIILIVIVVWLQTTKTINHNHIQSKSEVLGKVENLIEK